jgi:hypothetical protein
MAERSAPNNHASSIKRPAEECQVIQRAIESNISPVRIVTAQCPAPFILALNRERHIKAFTKAR